MIARNSLSAWLSAQDGAAAQEADVDMGFFTPTLARLSDALKSLQPRRPYNVLFFSRRADFFDVAQIERYRSAQVNSVVFCSEVSQLSAIEGKFDVALMCTHLRHDHLAQLIIRARGLAPLLLAWTWDNHHQPYKNMCFTSLVDLILPAHAFCADQLKTPHNILGPSFPLCTAQWSIDIGDELLAGEEQRQRSNSLYGGFIEWPGAPRNAQIAELQQAIPDNHLRLFSDRQVYFGVSPADRFRDWAEHKVSLCLPFAGDVSLRLFDALFAGQIPIVPADCPDLDSVVSPELQASLPIIRVDDVGVTSVLQAWTAGIERFDQMGAAGVRSRHAFARDHHHITGRLDQMLSYVAGIDGESMIDLKIDAASVGLVLDAVRS